MFSVLLNTDQLFHFVIWSTQHFRNLLPKNLLRIFSELVVFWKLSNSPLHMWEKTQFFINTRGRHSFLNVKLIQSWNSKMLFPFIPLGLSSVSLFFEYVNFFSLLLLLLSIFWTRKLSGRVMVFRQSHFSVLFKKLFQVLYCFSYLSYFSLDFNFRFFVNVEGGEVSKASNILLMLIERTQFVIVVWIFTECITSFSDLVPSYTFSECYSRFDSFVPFIKNAFIYIFRHFVYRKERW